MKWLYAVRVSLNDNEFISYGEERFKIKHEFQHETLVESKYTEYFKQIITSLSLQIAVISLLNAIQINIYRKIIADDIKLIDIQYVVCLKQTDGETNGQYSAPAIIYIYIFLSRPLS